MKQTQFNTVEANSSHDLITKITKDKVKNMKPQDTAKMYSVSIPSQRCVFYCANKDRVEKRLSAIEEMFPGIVTVVNKPLK